MCILFEKRGIYIAWESIRYWVCEHWDPSSELGTQITLSINYIVEIPVLGERNRSVPGVNWPAILLERSNPETIRDPIIKTMVDND